MNDHIKSATEYAFNNKVSDMQTEIESALQYKIANALEAQKIEVAKALMASGVSEGCGCEEKKELKGNQDKLDVAEPKGKLTAADFKKLRKEDEELDEKLTDDMPASKVIQDFVHSDNPKFKGKSKKERIKMALGAFYGMHKEEAEHIDESYEVGPENKSSHDGTVWHSVSYKGIPFGTIGTNLPQHQEKHGKWGFEDQAGNGRKQSEPKLNSKKDALNALIDRHKGILNQAKKVDEEAPSTGLSAEKKSEVVKKAKSGKDIGKKGKGFKKIVSAAKKGGAKDPEAVAAAAMWKNIKR